MEEGGMTREELERIYVLGEIRQKCRSELISHLQYLDLDGAPGRGVKSVEQLALYLEELKLASNRIGLRAAKSQRRRRDP